MPDGHRDPYTLKTPARFEVIHVVERLADTQADLESCMRGFANRSAGWSDMEVIQEAANIRNRSRQYNAMSALHAYGRIDRDEVNAAMAKHGFKSLCSALS